MEKAFAKMEELAGTIKEYVNARIASVKLNTAEKISGVMANVLAALVVAVVFLFFIIFASIALALVLAGWMGSTWAGFLIVALLYLLIGVVVWMARGKLIRMPIMNAIIQQLFKNDGYEED